MNRLSRQNQRLAQPVLQLQCCKFRHRLFLGRSRRCHCQGVRRVCPRSQASMAHLFIRCRSFPRQRAITCNGREVFPHICEPGIPDFIGCQHAGRDGPFRFLLNVGYMSGGRFTPYPQFLEHNVHAVDAIRDPALHLWTCLRDLPREGEYGTSSVTMGPGPSACGTMSQILTRPPSPDRPTTIPLPMPICNTFAAGDAQYAVKRYEQGNALDTACPICGQPVEDKDHMYWECSSGSVIRAQPEFVPFLRVFSRGVPALLRWRGNAPALRGVINCWWLGAPTVCHRPFLQELIPDGF